MEHQSDEDRDFIDDDGYKHDKDPTYVPDEEDLFEEDDKYVVTGQDFQRLTKKAKKLGAESLDYSKRKNNKYVKVNGLILPSLNVFRKIETINKKLEKLYSKELINGRMITINYSSIRDDEEEFVNILEEVENLIDDFFYKIKFNRNRRCSF